MDSNAQKLICPDCGFPLVEFGYAANSYEGEPDIPQAAAWRTYACGCYITQEELGDEQ